MKGTIPAAPAAPLQRVTLTPGKPRTVVVDGKPLELTIEGRDRRGRYTVALHPLDEQLVPPLPLVEIGPSAALV